MAGAKAVVMVVLLATAIGVFANDPDMLQDVCVADQASGTYNISLIIYYQVFI